MDAAEPAEMTSVRADEPTSDRGDDLSTEEEGFSTVLTSSRIEVDSSGQAPPAPASDEEPSHRAILDAIRLDLLERGEGSLPILLEEAREKRNGQPMQAGRAESCELDGYRLLAAERPGAAYYALCEAADRYQSELRVDDAQAVRGVVRRLVASHLQPYATDAELLREVRQWARARLALLFATAQGSTAPSSDQTVGGGFDGPAEESSDHLGADAAIGMRDGASGSTGASAIGDEVSRVLDLRHRWLLRLNANHNEQQPLRLTTLSDRLKLSLQDELWLVILLAIEGDSTLNAQRRRLLNNDDYYSVGVVLQMITDTEEDEQLFLDRLDIRKPLRRLCLIYLNAPVSRQGTGLSNHLIELDESVIAYVAGRDYWPVEIDRMSYLHPVERRPGQSYFASKLEKLDRAIRWRDREGGVFIALCGSTRDTNLSLALTWAMVYERPVVELSAYMLFGNPDQFENVFWRVLREALLRQAVLFIDGARSWEEHLASAAEVLRIVSRSRTFLTQPILFDAPLDGEEILKRALQPLFEVRTLPPTLDEQVVIWQDAIAHAKLKPLTEVELRKQVCDMALNVEDIHRAVRLANQNAYLTTEGAIDRLDPHALRSMATSKLNQGMYSIAERITTNQTWNDIILPNEVLQKLNEIVTYARYQREIFEEWGFGSKVPYGRANSSLFTGPPGTGKTMVAGIIAHELGMDLFRIETSQVVSKYIGETEKNLAKVFDEASRSHAIILFDEADSLFAKRTTVKDARDRYSNLEVNYLLQRIESFDGITILTSNFEENIDAAFARRIKFKIYFPAPNQVDRAKLWRLMLPQGAKVADKIDFERLSRAFEFTGASIKDAVLRAAFRAVEAGSVIDNNLLEETGIAVAREMGSLLRIRGGRVDLVDRSQQT
ncbi:MAG: ATP-binding protein [Bradymonadales bacterium]|nr:ATP-binding protein [Bradymonadales bacterium]